MVLEKPYYSSLKIIILMPLIVFFGSIVYGYIFGEETYNVYMVDKIFHFFGGIGISISAAGVLWQLLHRKIIVLQDRIVFGFLVFGFLCFVIITIYKHLFKFYCVVVGQKRRIYIGYYIGIVSANSCVTNIR